MTRSQKIFAAKAAIILAVPVIILGYAEGPPAGVTGAPGEGNCTGCHIGTVVNAGGGKVEITFADGMATYTPGSTKHVQVNITDSAAVVYGFEMTARLASDTSKQAGSFNPTDATTKVLCSDDSDRPAGGCTSTSPIEYIEHAGPFSNLSRNGKYEFDWMAPAADSGSITFYVSANAANGNRTQSGDHIYTSSVTITAASASGGAAVIGEGGVVNAASGSTTVTPGSWVSIFGQNLAPSTKNWDGLIVNGVFPLAIEGVSVTVNGKAASVNYVSSSQINIQAPDDTSTGPVAVRVTTPSGASNNGQVTLQAVSPGLFSFSGNGKHYASATLSSENLYYGSNDLLPGVKSKIAAPNDVVELWGTGFGPTKESMPAGSVVPRPSETQAPVMVQIGTVQVPAIFAGLVGAGLYQINVAVPELPDGEYPVTATVSGVSSQQGVLLQISH